MNEKKVLQRLEVARTAFPVEAEGVIVEALDLAMDLIRRLLDKRPRAVWSCGYFASGQHYRIDRQGHAWCYDAVSKRWVLDSEGPPEVE